MSEQSELIAKAIDIKGKSYVMVKDRILFFNEKYPYGSITTDLISSPEAQTVIIRAKVVPDVNHQNRAFTGYSQASWDDGYINKTSALENAETSAVGRALAMMGIGVIESIASADEINKAGLTTAQHEAKFAIREEEQAIADFQRKAFEEACAKTGKTAAQISAYLKELGNYAQVEQIRRKDFNAAIKWASSPSTVPANEEQLLAGLEASVASVEAKRAVKVTAAVKRAISANLDAAAPVLNHAESQESHVMEVSGVIADIKQLTTKTNRPFLAVKIADLPEDLAQFTCFDTALFPEIIKAKGKLQTLFFTEQVKAGKKYQTITSLEG